MPYHVKLNSGVNFQVALKQIRQKEIAQIKPASTVFSAPQDSYRIFLHGTIYICPTPYSLQTCHLTKATEIPVIVLWVTLVVT